MMNLTKKGLPNVVMIGGSPFSIYTDFRLWLRFEIEVSHMKKGDLIDIGYLFKNEKPEYCDMEELFAFSRPKSELPRSIGGHSNVIILDYEIDSDLIYSAFLGQYGIDLIDVEELHWHKFLALLGGLNESTKLREVMGYRNYEEETSKNRNIYKELKEAWTIEPPISEAEKAELEEFNRMFGG